MAPRSATAACFALLGACAGVPGAGEATRAYGPPPCERLDLGAMRNVALYGTVWTGSLPGPREIDLARRRGVATAIDVSPGASREETGLAEACARAGIEYVAIEAAAGAPDAFVDRVLDELRRSEERPVLLCSETGWRASMLVAIRRAADEGVPVEAAVAEARRSGMKPGEPEHFVREQVARLASR